LQGRLGEGRRHQLERAVPDGEFVRTRCFTRDVTDRKQLELELKRQNEELLRTVRFSEMFVGILGHDLRIRSPPSPPRRACSPAGPRPTRCPGPRRGSSPAPEGWRG